MIQKLLRNSLLKNSTLRGGHGWPRPDVPLDFNYAYKHKREISLYDTNLWFYDQSQPEYFMTYTEMHVHDPWTALKEFSKNWVYILGVFAILGVSLVLSQNTYERSLTPAFFANNYGNLKQIFDRRTGLKKNFLGLNLTGENGWIYFQYDPTCEVMNSYEWNKKQVDKIQKINEEGRNFVLSVEQQVRDELIAKAKKGGASHH